jgi:hypothetical protein
MNQPPPKSDVQRTEDLRQFAKAGVSGPLKAAAFLTVTALALGAIAIALSMASVAPAVIGPIALVAAMSGMMGGGMALLGATARTIEAAPEPFYAAQQVKVELNKALTKEVKIPNAGTVSFGVSVGNRSGSPFLHEDRYWQDYVNNQATDKNQKR